MMEGPRHQHLHQEWQEPLEELGKTAMGKTSAFTLPSSAAPDTSSAMSCAMSCAASFMCSSFTCRQG